MGTRQDVVFVRGGDLSCGRESGAELFRRAIEGHDNFEILGFFSTAGALAGGDAGGAEQRLVADQRYVTFEDLARQGVDGDVGSLTDLHVHDVGFVHLDFRSDHGHVGQRHEGGALRRSEYR